MVAAAFNQPLGQGQGQGQGMGNQINHHPNMLPPPATGGGQQQAIAPQPMHQPQAGMQPARWVSIYSCPQHGIVKGVVFDQAGYSHCPICNSLMVVK